MNNFKEALEDLITEMEKDAKLVEDEYSGISGRIIWGHVRQLRMLSKLLPSTPSVAPLEQKVLDLVKRAEDRREQQKVVKDEGGEKMLLCKDGPGDGCMTAVPTSVTEGMGNVIAGGVYRVKKDEEGLYLQFSKEETADWQKRQG